MIKTKWFNNCNGFIDPKRRVTNLSIFLYFIALQRIEIFKLNRLKVNTKIETRSNKMITPKQDLNIKYCNKKICVQFIIFIAKINIVAKCNICRLSLANKFQDEYLVLYYNYVYTRIHIGVLLYSVGNIIKLLLSCIFMKVIYQQILC